jgi:hypothetical protein
MNIKRRYVYGRLRTLSAQYRNEDLWFAYSSYSGVEVLAERQHQ